MRKAPSMARSFRTISHVLRILLLSAGMGFCILFSCLTGFPVAQAAGNFSYSITGSAFPGETVEVSLILPEGSPAVSGFRCGISYDEEKLTCTRIKGQDPVSGNALYISESPSEAICVFAAEDGAASYLSGDLITFTFRIPENITGGEVLSIALWVDQICGENGKPLESLSSFSKTIQIPIADAKGDLLAWLKPDCGSLSPVFSPDIFSYTLHVPSSTKEVHFEAKAQNGADISINRYRLQAAGKTTEIRITLTSEDKRKTVYLVTVYRDSASDTEDGHSSKTSSKGNSHTNGTSDNGLTESEVPSADVSGAAAQGGPLQILQNNLPQWTSILALLFSAASFVLILYFVLGKNKKEKADDCAKSKASQIDKEVGSSSTCKEKESSSQKVEEDTGSDS